MGFQRNGFKRMKMWLILGFTAVGGWQQATAQTLLEIRAGDYFTGEALIIDGNQTAARDLAKRELVQSLFQTIVLASESTTSEDAQGNIGGNISINIKSFSSIKLKGVRFMDVESREGKPSVLAYISQEDLSESFRQTEMEIRQLVTEASGLEMSAGLPVASVYFYEAWLRTFSLPQLVYYRPDNRPDSVLVATYLKSKLESYLQEVTLQTDDIREEMEANYTVSVKATYKGRPVRDLRLLANDPSVDAKSFTDGSGKLFIHRLPDKFTETLELELAPPLPPADPVFAEIEQASFIRKKRRIEVAFRPVIQFDFRVSKSSGQYLEFNPAIRNFSVSKLDWDFGDGYHAVEPAPRHQFDKSGRFTVKLTVNGTYRIEKDLSATGEVFATRLVIPDENGKPTPPVPAPPPPPASPAGSQQKRQVTDELLALSNGDLLFNYLNAAKQAGRLTFGKENQFMRPDECLVTIVDTNTRRVDGILQKKNGVWVNLQNQQEIRSINDQYRGKVVVWVQVF